ncbi:MAG: hypothetical protein R3F33_01630 [Planctomycetota bacterium]
MRFRALALCFAALTALAPAASAHDGPPYPICVDEAIGSLTLSIWADPDVGEGTFYYYVEPPADGVRVQAVARFQGVVSADGSSIPGDIEVRGISQDPEARAPYQQIGTLPFEHRGDWKVTFLVERGEQVLGQIELPIEVTPPGLGRLYLLWYAIPFFAAAAIWLRMFLASRASASDSRSAPESDAPGHDVKASGLPRP